MAYLLAGSGGGKAKSKIYCKSYLITDEGKTVQVKDMTDTVVATGELENQEILFEVPSTDKYTVEMLDSNDDVEYSTEVILNYGTFAEVKLGWTTTSFSGVQQILNAHKELDLLEVGMDMDETILKTGSIPMQWSIGAINQEGGHSVFFVPKWCLPTTRQMNSSDTNVGGWNVTLLRSWLNNEFLNDYLPDDIASLVKSRDIKISQGNKSTSLQTASDKIWLPREYEIFGATTYSAGTEHTSGNAEQFGIFATAGNRIKTAGKNGSACAWWECSPYVSSAARFCAVVASGSANSGDASSSYGVLPCFQLTSD